MKSIRWWRLGALLAATLALLLLAKMTGVTAYLEKDRLRGVVAAAGPLGALVFLAAFCAGELLHVPGTIFIVTAVVAYGRTIGGLLAYSGAMLSFSVVFGIVRTIGGKPLAEVKWSLAQRILAHLDERPVRTVILLRLIFLLSPQVNYVLAMTNVRFSRYFLGSAIGLALPVLGAVLLSDRLFN